MNCENKNSDLSEQMRISMETIGFANQTNTEIDWQKVGLAVDKTMGF